MEDPRYDPNDPTFKRWIAQGPDLNYERLPEQRRREPEINPASWQSRLSEQDGAYIAYARMRSAFPVTLMGLSNVVAIHEYINQQCRRYPELEPTLRRTEETLAYCVDQLLARYMGHRQ